MTVKENNIRPGLDIAVIGMAGQFPGSKHIHQFWENLKSGVESTAFFSNRELEESGVRLVWINDPNYVKSRPLLENIEYFDAGFFGYMPWEAEKMDPQMRFFHQCVWHGLEDAGYDPDTCKGVIGLYGGCTNNSFWEIKTMVSGTGGTAESMATSQLSDKDHMNSHISYKLNLTGPVFSVQTQCSTSLVAVHLACQGLLSGECDMALAGGVSILLLQKSGYLYQEGVILSPDGHCRPFDAKANGTIFGNGAAVVVLKRIEDAVSDRDHIYAVIKGTAVNNDGNRKAGYTAPSVEGQSDVIRTALQVSQVEPESITYIEAHGTGTSLGDPIEIEALKMAFNTEKRGFCQIGSVKGNVGHLDNAAGVTGMIKTILALNHGLIPPTIHFDKPNPAIDFENSPFLVNNRLTPWESRAGLRRAGVSSFGIGGTNAHVVLEEFPCLPGSGVSPPEKSRQYQFIPLSARTKTSLERMTQNLAAHFKKNPHINLADAAYTLQVGRKTCQYRQMVVCSTVQEAIDRLTGLGAGDIFDTKDRKTPVVLMCSPGDTASSALYKRLIQDLYNEEAVFHREMDRCFEILYPHDPLNKVSEMSGGEPPLIFAYQYALARLLMHWGIKPGIIFGHGQGEIVAACLNNDLPLDKALKQAVNTSYPHPLSHPSPTAAKTIALCLKNSNTLFIETGPGQALSQLVKRHSGITPDHQFIHLLGNHQHEESQYQSLHRLLVNWWDRMWRCGVTPDWTKINTGEERQRVSLPGYCFEPQPYPVDNSEFRDIIMQSAALAPILIKKTDIRDWFYIPSWERSFFPGLPQTSAEGCWLVFMDTCGIGRTLVERWEVQNPHPAFITVDQGTTFEKINHSRFLINPGEAGHYDNLFKELQKLGNVPDKILYLWGVSVWEFPGLTWEESESVAQMEFYSLLNLVRALGKAGIGSNIRLEVVTTNMQEVTGEENLNPLKATIMGAVKVIPLEYPHIRCRSIDILLSPGNVPGTAGTIEDGLIDRLLAELGSEPTSRAVAFRGKHRWEQTVISAPLEEAVAREIPCFKQKGVYLITGGLGGMGFTFAQHLAEQYHASLVLTGRTALPGKDQENPKKEKIRQLEQLGAQVMVVSADVSQQPQMETVVHRAKERFGCIDGIIHAAGVADYAGVIQRRTREMTEQVLAPKVTGTLVLDHLLKEEEIEPDFVVLCSSISSINAPFGEVGYTAANAFLDAYAHYRNSLHKGKTLSINWGPWQEVGMAVDALKRIKRKPDKKDDMLNDGISPGEGVEILTRALTFGFPQVAVSTRDLKAIIEQAQVPPPRETAQNRPQHSRPELATPYVPPNDEIEEQLVNIWKDFLGLKKVGIHDNFFELGATSLDIVQVNDQVNETFNTNIPVVTLFENPTISSLAGDLTRMAREDNALTPVKTRSDELQDGKKLMQKRLQKRKKEK